MINKLIKQDRKLGRYVKRPEGAFISAFSRMEAEIGRKVSDVEKKEEVLDEIEKLYYKPDSKIDSELIKEIRRQLRSKIVKSKNRKNTSREETSFFYIDSNQLDFKNEIDGFSTLLETENLKKALRDSFGAKTSFDFVASTWKEPVLDSKKEHIPIDWHLDHYLRASKLRCFIFLSDESQRHAPMQIIDRESTRKLLKNYKISELRAKPEIVGRKADIKEFKGRPGEYVIFNPATNLHRATIPTEKDYKRKTLMLDFIPEYGNYLVD